MTSQATALDIEPYLRKIKDDWCNRKHLLKEHEHFGDITRNIVSNVKLYADGKWPTPTPIHLNQLCLGDLRDLSGGAYSAEQVLRVLPYMIGALQFFERYFLYDSGDGVMVDVDEQMLWDACEGRAPFVDPLNGKTILDFKSHVYLFVRLKPSLL